MDTPTTYGALVARRAKETPDATYIVEAETGRTWTYAELVTVATNWATRLAGRGVREGDTVATMLHNEGESAAIWIAIGMLGAIEAPGNLAYRGRFVRHFLRLSGARVLIADVESLPQVMDVVTTTDVDHVLVVGDGASAAVADRAVAGDGRTVSVIPASDIALDEVDIVPVKARINGLATIMQTSGTTGASKGVMISWRQLHETALGWIPIGGEDSDGRTHRALYLEEDESYYSPYPFHHMAARAPLHLMALTNGTIVLRRSFKTQKFWEDVRTYGCTSTELLGTMALFLSSVPETADDAENPLKSVLMVPLIDGLEKFNRRFGVRTFTVFNMTELSVPIVSEGYDLADGTSCGRVRPGYECRIVDADDEPVPTGEVGELLVRAQTPHALMDGYWRMPEATVDAWRDQWLHTGDAFRCDKDGNYYFVDRLKDTIRRRGENISSIELEGELLQHPSVAQAAAIGVPSDVGDEEVKVVVVPRDGAVLDREDLLAFLAERLPAFMVPRYLEVVETLPKTPTQKVRKVVLRESWMTENTWDRVRQSFLPNDTDEERA